MSVKHFINVMQVKQHKLVSKGDLNFHQNLMQLKYLSDAIHSMEKISPKPAEIKSSYLKCAEILKNIQPYLYNQEDKDAITFRSDYLREFCLKNELLTSISGFTEKELLILIGPMLNNWKNQMRKKEFSYVSAIPDNFLKDYLDKNYNDKLLMQIYLQKQADEKNLILMDFPKVIVANLYSVGGGADHFPKNFAYFLPEDEGYFRSNIKKTIIFANLIMHRFNYTSKNLGKEFIHDFQFTGLSMNYCVQQLLLWMRGHDIGHFIRLPETNYAVFNTVGRFTSMALQEMIADCVGYLMSSPVCGFNFIPQNSSENKYTIFVCELLRYALKDNGTMPDTYAALYELNFLVSHGFITIRNNKIMTTPQAFYEGIKALFHEAVHKILTSDLNLIQDFTLKYGNKNLHRTLKFFLLNAQKNLTKISLWEHIEYIL